MKVRNLIIICFLFTGFLIFSESIEDNEFYKKGVELLNSAKQEYDKGDYDKGYDYSEQAKENFIKAHQYNLIRILTLQLNKAREIAVNYLEKVKTSGMNNNSNSTKYYNEALTFFNEGDSFYNTGNDKTDYKEKGDLFQKAIDDFENSSKLCEMALRGSSDDKSNAEKLIQQAKDKRNNLIASKIIINSDSDDKDIMNNINDSQNYFNNNDYSNSILKSNEAMDLMDKIKLKKEAEALLAKAKILFNKSKGKGAEKDFPDKFNEAALILSDAEKNYKDSKYKESIDNSNNVIGILNSFGYKFGDTFPKYYKVRKLRPTTDCFWKIASYPFIYNDKSKWKIIYEANKDKLPNSKNPNLIYTDIILIIPSIAGEEREDEYDSAKNYPKFKP